MIQNIQNKTTEEKQTARSYPYWKIGVLTILLLLGFAALAIRLFVVQVVQADKYSELARRQYEFRVEMKPERGILYDRTKKPLAITIRSTSYAADPTMIKNPDKLAKILSQVTGDSVQFWQQKLSQAKGSFIWLLRNGYFDTKPLDTLQDPGLIRIKEPRRTYLYGETGSQVIGCTNVDNKGLNGLELSLDELLRGTKGQKILLRDGRGNIRPMVDFPTVPAVNGNSVITTLDLELQRIAEYELRNGIEESGASSGTVVAIEPSTGEILALASSPSFNPNFPEVAATETMRLRAITDMYEPGSTFKLITAAAAIEEGVIAPQDTVSGESGVWHYGDVEVKDSHPIGKVTFSQALEQSSNVVFAKISQKISNDVFYKYARDFGYGIESGIDITGEVKGKLKKPRQFDGSTKIFMSYGYQLAATALQTLNAYSAIANKGTMMKPYLVKSVLNDDGEIIEHQEPQKIRQVVSEKTAATLTTMLKGVVEYGTAQQARIPGMYIAGKTGTAQQLVDGEYNRSAYTASFVGYFPADAPRLAMIVMLDKPLTNIYGGMTAAPIFRRIASRWISAKRIAVTSTLAAKETAIDSVIVPELRGMSIIRAKDIAKKIGLALHHNAEKGTIIMQSPSAGMLVPKSLPIIVTIRTKTNLDSTKTRPDVRGMSTRSALSVLHAAGHTAVIKGTGYVAEQRWFINKNQCLLICYPNR